MSDPVEVLGPALIVRGPALAALYFCVLKGISAAHQTGYDATQYIALQESIRAAHRAHTSQLRHDDVAQLHDEPLSGGHDEDDRITVNQAAAVMGVTARTVQRLAERHGLGRRVGGKGSSWVLKRSLVMAHKAVRDEQNRGT